MTPTASLPTTASDRLAGGAQTRTSLLGVAFELTAERAADLDYVHAFVDAYDEADVGPDRRVAVRVVREPPPAVSEGEEVWVHRSKHGYWNFRGSADFGPPRVVAWHGKGVAVTVPDPLDAVTVAADPGLSPARAGEATFHVCRSLALYLRDAGRGNLLHASAVECAGRAVLFVGGVNAGKTTLALESVLRHGCRPLANDRVLATAEAAPAVVSWPSYCSYAEGTLLRYPQLHAAALAYEREECRYRTQRWGPSLAPRYTKDSKRVYPMVWFTDATGIRYRRRAPLGLLLHVRVSPEIPEPVLEPVRPDDDEARAGLLAMLAEESFDTVEPSFYPWHGLARPRGAPPLDDFVRRVDAAGVPVYRLELPAEDLDFLAAALAVVRTEAP